MASTSSTAAGFYGKLFPPFPDTQAVNSTTFVKPPLDGSINIAQMFDHHGEHSPTHPLLTYPVDAEDGRLRTIDWKEASGAVRRGAGILRSRVDPSGARECTKWKVPMVAIVSSADTVTFFTSVVAVQRADCTVFVISPRNSPAAVAHLLNKIEVDHLLVGRELTMKDLVSESLALLKTDYPHVKIPELSPMFTYEDLYLSNAPVPSPSSLPLTNTGIEDITMYFHSSGSTNFPKPTLVTNKKFIEFALIAFWGGQDLCGQKLALHVMPIYHGMGAVQIMLGALTGLSFSCFEPKSPAVVPTSENFLDGARRTGSGILLSVPTFVESWTKDEEAVGWLAKNTTGIIYGGGPLNREAGDILAKAGVQIFSMYGTIEAGTISSIIPAKAEPDWAYIEFTRCMRIEMRHHYDEYYEVVIVSGPFNIPSVINTTSRGVDAYGVERDLDAYATGDLWVEHPERKGTWRIYGRTDDQLMHSTGEKTNPGPLESMMNQDPHVKTSIMFGRGRFQAGIIIDPKPEFTFDPADEAKLSEFRNLIWPTVERMNEYAPQHSRLFKEMILVVSPSKPVTYTSKNTPRRQATINEYEPEINALYDAVEQSSASLVPPPSEFTPITTLDFTRSVISNILRKPLFDTSEGDEKDLFEYGCDSLQATWVRNALLKGIREEAGKRGLDVRSVSDSIVYRHPTVKLLAGWVYKFLSATHTNGVQNGVSGQANGHTHEETDEEKVKKMEEMVEKYTTSFLVPISPPRYSSSSSSGSKVVLLTGTTGGLGSNTLATLMDDPSVNKVYALNRPGKLSLRDRQRAMFEERGLGSKVGELEGGKVVLLESDTSSPGLGLDVNVFEDIKRSVTHIIHNAWRVDFNLALSSFESNIKGVRNLVDLALSVGARLLFISSVGCLQNAPPDYPMTEKPATAHVAIGNGYTESKWVSEQIVSFASQQHGLSAMNIRIGQLAGGVNGNWTTKEWFPTIVQSAKVIGCLPAEEGSGKEVGWIQVHVAAQAVVDYLDAPNEVAVTHVTHPHPVPFSSLLPAFTKPLGAAAVSYQEWLTKVEEYATIHAGENDVGEKLPATRLLDFYRETGRATGAHREAFGLLKLENSEAVKASQRLRNAPKMDEAEAEGWVRYWQSAGLL